ncbi:hypothetical protein [Anaerorhabdus furcosa]|uniref:Uncharacterized protein n=1 Tax=Anaerorhabdus furcosa TaxID=118967 RepID=A0A1T4QM85_9FIRM|nr:hypothetical protein [Anaerorhabdus furcosa]SKA04388.1 hypothetical protein SAMN02745191_0057 [Anaerorhabdus furcosa]
MLNGHFKAGNKAYKKTEAILNIAKNDEEKEKFYTMLLNTATDANILTKCCAHMLRLSINTEIARQKLNSIAKDKTIHPLLMSNAKLFLQEGDKGNIKSIV